MTNDMFCFWPGRFSRFVLESLSLQKPAAKDVSKPDPAKAIGHMCAHCGHCMDVTCKSYRCFSSVDMWPEIWNFELGLALRISWEQTNNSNNNYSTVRFTGPTCTCTCLLNKNKLAAIQQLARVIWLLDLSDVSSLPGQRCFIAARPKMRIFKGLQRLWGRPGPAVMDREGVFGRFLSSGNLVSISAWFQLVSFWYAWMIACLHARPLARETSAPPTMEEKGLERQGSEENTRFLVFSF